MHACGANKTLALKVSHGRRGMTQRCHVVALLPVSTQSMSRFDSAQAGVSMRMVMPVDSSRTEVHATPRSSQSLQRD